MANKFRNEMELEVAGDKILLRPTFENCANLEAALGYGLPMLAYNLASKKMPALTDLAKVIYFCQAEKNLKLEQVWDLVQAEGVNVTVSVLSFIAKITSGDKTQVPLSEETIKKN